MFGIGSTELLIILIVALVLIGPSKLPDMMRMVGKGLSEFRRMSMDVKSTLEREIEKADEAKRIEETKKELFGDDQPAAEAKKDEPAKAAAEAASAEAKKDESAKAAAEAASAEAKKDEPAKAAAEAASAEATAAKADTKTAAKEEPKPQDTNHA